MTFSNSIRSGLIVIFISISIIVFSSSCFSAVSDLIQDVNICLHHGSSTLKQRDYSVVLELAFS